MGKWSFDIVVVSGGFDPMHVGHVRMIKKAAQTGHQVIVGLNSDDWLRRKKDYVFMPWEERAEILSAMRGVLEVMPFDDRDGSACNLLAKVIKKYPSDSIAFANGGDRNSGNIPEVKFAHNHGIALIWETGGSKIQSSSDLVNKII
tara:strand:+ start:4261 stop:4698 length:438 start_codon:yes stop_codon:yes gene_type:complete